MYIIITNDKNNFTISSNFSKFVLTTFQTVNQLKSIHNLERESLTLFKLKFDTSSK